MYMYELFLSDAVEGKKIHFIQTTRRNDNSEAWLKKLVKDNTITEDVAKAVEFVW